MALIDVVKWDDPRSDEYAWRYSDPSGKGKDVALSTWTQLIVNESQEAVLLRGGQMAGPFGPGRHTLSTENLPVLDKLINLPFGGKSPFSAEVWFTNKAMPLDVKWGTSDPIQLQDPRYNVMLPVQAYGQYGVQIANSRKFLTKLVGATRSFRRENLVSYFRGLVLTRVKDCIARTIIRDRVSILEISAHLNAISSVLEQELAKGLDEFGLRLINFFVNSISTPEDDPAVLKLKAVLARRAEMDILGFTYQQERSFDTLERAAGNEGGNIAPIMQAGMGLGMGVAVGVPLGTAMGDVASQMRVAPPQGRVEKVLECSSCRQQNPLESRFCSGCGTDLTSTKAPPTGPSCSACGTPSVKASRFCHNCGAGLSRACVKCSASLQDGARFCSTCGTPQP